MRSCNSPISVARLGWYPTALGMRPSKAETSDPACVKRKMLSMNSSVSAPSLSRKYSATVRPGRATRRRARLNTSHTALCEPQVFAFARALADPGKHRKPAVLLGDVVDQLLNEDG